MKGQGKRKKSKSSRNPADDVGSTAFDKWVIKELHGIRREAPAALPWPRLRGAFLAPGVTSPAPGVTSSAPGVTSPALHSSWAHLPWDTQQSSREGYRQFCSKESRGSFLLSLLSVQSHRLGRGMWLPPTHGWSFPQKGRLIVGEGPPQKAGLQL